MTPATLVVAGSAIVLAVVAYYFHSVLWFCWLLVVSLSCLCSGPLLLLITDVILAPKPRSGPRRSITEINEFRDMLIKSCKQDDKEEQNRYPIVISRVVDGATQNLLDLVFRDFVGCWLNEQGFKTDQLIDCMKQDLWSGIQKLHERLSKIDQTKLVACSIVERVTYHFEKIRIALEAASENEDPVFTRSIHLMSDEAELDYLRRVSEVFILFFLPRNYSLPPTKFLLREIITCKIVKPAIDQLLDPDYINQKILAYIEQQNLAEAVHKKTCEYAESFEDFILMIQQQTDLEVLKHIRFNIVGEIVQATVIQNDKRARGLDSESTALAKSDIAQARKLKRYINQLTYAKKTCENHMVALGWDECPLPDTDATDVAIACESQVLSLQTILENASRRRYFTQFLETVSAQELIGYWGAVQELRVTERSNWHQLGAEIFYTYIKSPTTLIPVDKDVKKRMESFLLGDKGPDVFYQVQDNVLKTLQEKYYSSFVASEQYKKMQEALSNDHGDDPVMNREKRHGLMADPNSLLVGEHYSRSKLDQLQEKLNNKSQALQALKSSLKPESRVLGILAKEVEWLQGEKRQLEVHLNHTEMWAEHLGCWRADVQTAELPENGESPQFVLVVHMVADEADESSISTGWVVSRRLTDFQELHRKLRQLCPNVRNLELPSQPLKFFGKSDKSSLDRAKVQIQKYLNFILEDERLNQSEALYAFLSPSSEHLKHAEPSSKKSRFSLSTLFKITGVNLDSRDKDEEDDASLLLDDESGRSFTDGVLGPGKDAIAEPLYTLLSEIFDLRGVFRWLRRSLINFVQIAYGRTINRQVRDTVAWIFSEPMLHYYIQTLMKSWWPNGQLVSEERIRTEKEKLKTRSEARKQFVNNVPDVLTSLVGTQSAQRGATKVFDTLQNINLNKELFYDIFEVLIYEMFPELQNRKDEDMLVS